FGGSAWPLLSRSALSLWGGVVLSDVNSDGLLLMTNAGELAHYLEHPKAGFERTYRVRFFGPSPTAANFEAMANGLTVDGVLYRPIKAEFEGQSPFEQRTGIRRSQYASTAAVNEAAAAAADADDAAEDAAGGDSGRKWLRMTLHEGRFRE